MSWLYTPPASSGELDSSSTLLPGINSFFSHLSQPDFHFASSPTPANDTNPVSSSSTRLPPICDWYDNIRPSTFFTVPPSLLDQPVSLPAEPSPDTATTAREWPSHSLFSLSPHTPLPLHVPGVAFPSVSPPPTALPPERPLKEGYFQYNCDRCRVVIQLPKRRSESHLREHHGSRACQRTYRNHCNRIRGSSSVIDSMAHTLSPALQSISPSRLSPSSSESASSITTALACAHSVSPPPSSTTAPSPSLALPCPGVRVPWTAGSILHTFPWELVEPIGDGGMERLSFGDDEREANEVPFGFGKLQGQDLWLRSSECTGHVAPSSSECNPCSQIHTSSRLQRIKSRASKQWKPHSPYNSMNRIQLVQALKHKSAQLSSQNVKVLSSV